MTPGPEFADGDARNEPCCHDVAQLEDLLLLSRYDAAVEGSAELVRELALRAGTAPLLPRALLVALQAHFYSGRQAEVECLIEELGMQCVSVPTFLAWMLLLLESGQAAAARQRVERYMALLVAAAPHAHHHHHHHHHQQQQQQPPLEGPPSASVDDVRRRDSSAGGATGPAGGPAAPGGLHPDAPQRRTPDQHSRQSDPRQHKQKQHQQHAHAVVSEGGGGLLATQVEGAHACRARCSEPGAVASVSAVASASWQDRAALARLYSQDVLALGLGLPLEALLWLGAGPPPPPPPQQQQQQQQQGGAAAARGQVVAAVDLLAGCPDVTVAALGLELQQLLEAAGLGGGLASAAPAREDARSRAPAAVTAGPAAGAGATGLAGRPAPGLEGAGARGAGRDVPSHAAKPAPAELQRGAAHVPPPGVAAVLCAWLAALRAALRRLASAAAARLTAAQAWTLCTAAAALSRLRAAARAPGLGPASGSGASYAHRAGALAVVAGLLALAAQAEAPHLRAALRGRVAALAGMVGEALRMGLALHPSPVATVAAY